MQPVEPVEPVVASMLPIGGYVWAQPVTSLAGVTMAEPAESLARATD
jgi:hypothetical protein